MRLEDATVAVTGAAGFIGARLVEHLILTSGARVRAVVRTFGSLARLSELPQERLSFHAADIADAAAVDAAIGDADVIVHCAFGSRGEPGEQWRDTVQGARSIAEAAARSSARLVHVSTAAVLDPGPAPVLSDDSPKVSAEYPSYEHAKLEAEQILLEACPASVALRPTVVYGPWGRDWTALPLRRLEAGEAGLPGGPGYGPSNALYVDDLVGAIVSACESSCSGPILIAGDERVEWGLFYDSCRAVLGLAAAMRDATPLPDWESRLYGQAARADLTRARRLLGYRPRVSFAAGMERVAGWHRWMTGASGWTEDRPTEPPR